MVRFNNLKIYINANEAKVGGTIGAMLSPYLFSINILDFCKKFNECTFDFENDVLLNVKVYADIVEKVYTFFICFPSISPIYKFIYKIFGTYTSVFKRKKILINYIFDICKYISYVYKINFYTSYKLIFGIIKGFRFSYRIFFSKIFLKKVNYFYAYYKKKN